MKIRYNAPVTLTFALVSTSVLLIAGLLGSRDFMTLFTAPGRHGFDSMNPLSYVRLMSHVAGHVSWQHLLGNFTFILLLGPILEEKYSSVSLFVMIIITALVTGILNVLFFHTALLGASGIAFMMILLMSFTNVRRGEIPVTFFLVIALFLIKEIVGMFEANDISEFAHLVGGACGSLFGFLRPRRTKV